MADIWINYNGPYRYTRLASQDSIRLIKIVPGLINHRYIGCKISDLAYSQANVGRAKYRALSYLWGDPTPSREIALKDGTFPGGDWHIHRIHSNLWLFLAHMWRKEQFEDLLWTDRLCLNQGDEEEMAEQIPRMGLIYSQAEEVVIWLGLSAWQEQHLQEQRDRLDDRLHWQEQPLERRLAIFSVLEHDYWKRMWIMQEVAMAQKVVVEMQDIPSFDLQEMGQTIRRFVVRDGTYRSHMFDLIKMRGPRGATPSSPKSSWILLRDHCQRQCTRPQDRIYGLLGMVKENDPLRQISIDYDKPASDVLFDALFTVSNRSLRRDKTFLFIKALISTGLLADVNSLEEYSNKDHSWKLTENEVVKAFARITLGVFDSLNLIMATFGGLKISYVSPIGLEKLMEQTESLDPPGVDEFQWKVIVGIIMTLGDHDFCEEIHERWKKVRWPKLKAQSLWLCARHALPTPSPRPLAPKHLHGPVVMTQRLFEFRPNEVVKACANYRQHEHLCKGSKMILDIPGSGTRLEFDYASSTHEEAVFKIWFENERASGSV